VRGSLYLSNRQAKESLIEFTDSIEQFQVVLKADPRSVQARQLLWFGSYSRAVTLGQLNRHREAIADWERALEFGPRHQRFCHCQGRAGCLARAGEHQRALSEALALVRGTKTGAGWYFLAHIAA